jgi:NAD(P)-dependent dehydrogenase (short-subunit alcohol dehydrogenase family)
MHPQPAFEPRYRGSDRLAGKVAIVTGGDSGIGRAVAVHFACEGADLAILYLDEHEDAEETARLVAGYGRKPLLIAGDVGSESFCRDAVERVVAHFGQLDVLVNNAAEQHEVKEALEIDEAQLDRTVRTNLYGYIFMAKHALRHMGEGAAIVNCTSITAYRGSDSLIDYAATKGAIVALTRSLASAVVDRGIRVNGVAPGPIWTPLIPASFDPDRVASHGASAPMKRAGQPNEVAPSFVFLACEDASYMTGQVLHPNGGSPVGS